MAMYLIDYVNKKEFKQLEKSLKTYNIKAYNKLIKKCYPSLKKGEFLGGITNSGDIVSYEFYLNDKYDIRLVYSVYSASNIVILNTIMPTSRILASYDFTKEIFESTNHSDNPFKNKNYIFNDKLYIYDNYDYLSEEEINEIIFNCFDKKKNDLDIEEENKDKNFLEISKYLFSLYEYAQKKLIDELNDENIYLLATNKNILESVAELILKIGNEIIMKCDDKNLKFQYKECEKVELFQYTSLNFIYDKYVDNHFDLVTYFKDSKDMFFKQVGSRQNYRSWFDKCLHLIRYWDDLLYDYRNVMNYFLDIKFNFINYHLTHLGNLVINIAIESMPEIKLNSKINGYICGFIKVLVYENDVLVGDGLLSGYGNVFFDKNSTEGDGVFDWNLVNTSFNTNTKYEVICKIYKEVKHSENLKIFVQPLKLWIVGEKK